MPLTVPLSLALRALADTTEPDSTAFIESGRVIARLAAREGWQPFDEKPSLVNDALIAVSCREVGATLITKDSDFTRLSPLIRGFRHVAPWPSLSLP